MLVFLFLFLVVIVVPCFDQRITSEGLAEELSYGFWAETLTRIFFFFWPILKTSLLLKPHNCGGARQR